MLKLGLITNLELSNLERSIVFGRKYGSQHGTIPRRPHPKNDLNGNTHVQNLRSQCERSCMNYNKAQTYLLQYGFVTSMSPRRKRLRSFWRIISLRGLNCIANSISNSLGHDLQLTMSTSSQSFAQIFPCIFPFHKDSIYLLSRLGPLGLNLLSNFHHTKRSSCCLQQAIQPLAPLVVVLLVANKSVEERFLCGIHPPLL